MRAMATRRDWRVLCSRGAALVFIGRHPGCTASEIARGLFVTERTVWNVLADLRRAGMVDFSVSAGSNRYTVNEEARFPDPLLAGITVGQVISGMRNVAGAAVAAE